MGTIRARNSNVDHPDVSTLISKSLLFQMGTRVAGEMPFSLFGLCELVAGTYCHIGMRFATVANLTCFGSASEDSVEPLKRELIDLTRSDRR